MNCIKNMTKPVLVFLVPAILFLVWTGKLMKICYTFSSKFCVTIIACIYDTWCTTEWQSFVSSYICTEFTTLLSSHLNLVSTFSTLPWAILILVTHILTFHTLKWDKIFKHWVTLKLSLAVPTKWLMLDSTALISLAFIEYQCIRQLSRQLIGQAVKGISDVGKLCRHEMSKMQRSMWWYNNLFVVAPFNFTYIFSSRCIQKMLIHPMSSLEHLLELVHANAYSNREAYSRPEGVPSTDPLQQTHTDGTHLQTQSNE